MRRGGGELVRFLRWQQAHNHGIDLESVWFLRGVALLLPSMWAWMVYVWLLQPLRRTISLRMLSILAVVLELLALQCPYRDGTDFITRPCKRRTRAQESKKPAF